MGLNILTKSRMAIRNIVKNRRRSVVTLATIAIGFTALSLFEGYFTYVYRALEQEAIVGERLGHLTVVKRGFYDHGTNAPKEFKFDEPEMTGLINSIENIEGVKLVSPRLNASGLISNGEVSHIFLSEGIRAEDLKVLRSGEFSDMPGNLVEGRSTAVVLGSELAKMLSVDPAKLEDSELVMMTSTIDGMVSASDVEIAEVSNTGSVGTNDKFALMPLALARSLYEFDGADRLVVLLDDSALATEVNEKIQTAAAAQGLDVELRDWKALSVYYTQVKGLFDMMYLFISLVILVVVVASVLNTIGMSISERTREIGTFRSLGMRRKQLTSLFVIEGVALVIAGCVFGVILTYVIGNLINLSDLTYIPPDASEEANLIVDILLPNLMGSLIVFSLFAAIASYFPSRRAAKLPITEALSHV